ncbi:MAG: hypothetical protein HY554_08135, partial [Elusimicrobia bacterium]|nr:hypothetical protein [Elusimicrobiota bacterium]
ALRKLAAYQLQDPAAFALCWVRAGVASGCTWIDGRVESQRVEVRFDGRPWTEAELEDPYSAFFGIEGPEGARGRQLVMGALAAMRLGAESVSIVSGVGTRRRGCLLAPEAVARVEAPDEGAGTVLEAAWPSGLRPAERQRVLGRLHGGCSMAEPPLTIFSAEGSSLAEKAFDKRPTPSLSFQDGPLRGVLLPDADKDGHSDVRLYSLGALASSIQWTFPTIQVQAHLDDPRFALDASQSGVALNARFKEAMETLGAQAERLLALTLDRHAERYRALTRFLFEGRFASAFLGRANWREDGVLDRLLAAGIGKSAERRELLEWERVVSSWLRDTAARVPEKRREEPLFQRLFAAPLYLSVTGDTLTLADLEQILKRAGVLPVSHRIFPGERIDPPVLWCPWRKDPVVERLFAGRVRWFDSVETFRELKPAGPAPRPRPRRR